MSRHVAPLLLCAAAALAMDMPAISLTAPGDRAVVRGAGSRLNLHYLADGELLWTDPWAGSGARWAAVPGWLSMATAMFGGDRLLAKGAEARYRCPHGVARCELFVFQYRCHGCDIEDGDLPVFLGSKGWSSFGCAPRFRLRDGGVTHPMKGWRLVVDGDTWTDLVTEEDMQFVAFAMKPGLVDCDVYAARADCEAAVDERCAWVGGVCEFQVCGPADVGPVLPFGQCATPCVGLELETAAPAP
ncbi:hypothetical protein DIPPA_07429 [Diplonema papillatum]|nr:hypothetical protein DIPPA_19930 [Diplonema papillatum]KAJ9451289.1 hypothetical protein DIPPA_07429 [Diplonema papillatum]